VKVEYLPTDQKSLILHIWRVLDAAVAEKRVGRTTACSGDTMHRVLPPSVVEAIAGAVGEVVQVAILYPLDTIKVKE